jgi:hypothetical protein
MKRFVRSEAWLATAFTLIAFLIVSITHASLGATYAIVLGFVVICFWILSWPERVQLWREMRGRSLPRRPRR